MRAESRHFRYVLRAVIVALYVLILDGIWLVSRRAMYKSMIRNIQHRPLVVHKGWAAVAYALMIAGILFISGPQANHDLTRAAFYGFFLGMLTYGIYNATNAATLRAYDRRVAFLDTLWGAVLFSSATVLYVLAERLF